MASPDPQKPANGLYYAAVIFPLIALACHSVYYLNYYCDDAFISLRYAARLLSGHGLTFNDGEQVEGYSNLLWVLLCAIIALPGIPLFTASYLIGAASAIALFTAIGWHGRATAQAPALTLLTNLFLAATAPLAIWTVGGMEPLLLTALLSWAYVIALQPLTLKRQRILGLLLGLISITRPEGVLFTALLLAALRLTGRQPYTLRPAFLIAIGFFLAQLLFRLSYYGDILPNTFYAKAALTPHRLYTGMVYTSGALRSLWPLVILALIAATRASLLSFCAFVALPWLTVVTLGGGDIFPGYRHLLPILPLLLLTLADSIAPLYLRLKPLIALPASLAFVALYAAVQTTTPENLRAFDDTYQWYGATLGTILKDRYQKTQPLVAVTMAGAIPFYSGLPTLDMLGLNDHTLTHNINPAFGQGTMGHELFDPDYYFARQPDIFIFGWKDEPWNNLGADPRFIAQYQKKTIPMGSAQAVIWLRKDSAKARP